MPLHLPLCIWAPCPCLQTRPGDLDGLAELDCDGKQRFPHARLSFPVELPDGHGMAYADLADALGQQQAHSDTKKPWVEVCVGAPSHSITTRGVFSQARAAG